VEEEDFKLNFEKFKEKNRKTCGTCAFFGKFALCLRRERYAGAIPCASFVRKALLQEEATSPMFPLLPDTGIKESEEEREATLGPSPAWYLVPFLFGIIGGIVAYVGVKNKDENMALGLLLFGLIWTLVVFVLYIAIISYYLSILF